MILILTVNLRKIGLQFNQEFFVYLNSKLFRRGSFKLLFATTLSECKILFFP